MANVTYRASSTSPIPSSTTVKNSPLTNAEGDGNMRSIIEDLDTKATTAQLTAVQQKIVDNAISMRSIIEDLDTKATTAQLTAVQQQIVDNAISMAIALG